MDGAQGSPLGGRSFGTSTQGFLNGNLCRWTVRLELLGGGGRDHGGGGFGLGGRRLERRKMTRLGLLCRFCARLGIVATQGFSFFGRSAFAQRLNGNIATTILPEGNEQVLRQDWSAGSCQLRLDFLLPISCSIVDRWWLLGVLFIAAVAHGSSTFRSSIIKCFSLWVQCSIAAHVCTFHRISKRLGHDTKALPCQLQLYFQL